MARDRLVRARIIQDLIATLVEGSIPQSSAEECLAVAVFVDSRDILLEFVHREVPEDFREQNHLVVVIEEQTQDTRDDIVVGNNIL